MIQVKDGVLLHGLSEEIWQAAQKADEVYKRFGADGIVITSGRDGTHMRGSKHYVGQALDVRTWTVPEDKHGLLVASLKDGLGPDYDVVLEKTHIHMEYDPKCST